MANKKAPKGSVSSQELELIKAYAASGLSAADIGSKLGRAPETIQKHLIRAEVEAEAEFKATDPTSPRYILDELHKSHFWGVVKSAFKPSEQQFYEREWLGWMIQFGEDITHAERSQVNKLITNQLLQNRCLRDISELNSRLEKLETERERMERLHDDHEKRPDRVKAKLVSLESDYKALSELRAAKAREMDVAEGKSQKLFEDLKATRHQRLERIEKRGRGFLELMTEVLSSKKRDELGRQAELMRLAVLKKAEELGQLHQYSDGTFDRPLLNCNTVMSDETVVHLMDEPPKELPPEVLGEEETQ